LFVKDIVKKRITNYIDNPIYEVENTSTHLPFLMKCSYVRDQHRIAFEILINEWENIAYSCEYIVHFEEYFFIGNYACVIMEYCPFGTLRQMIDERVKDEDPFSKTVLFHIFLFINLFNFY
jgi:serine/threonine protein kinase